MSAPSRLSPGAWAGVPEKLEIAAISRVIPTLPNEIAVVSAPPGSGKSTAVYTMVARLLADRISGTTGPLALASVSPPSPVHVLWAVQGIYGSDSLGQEALRSLNACLVTTPYSAKLLMGRASMPSASAYFAQFQWPTDIAVHIISHAHLPFLLADDRPTFVDKFMKDVDLIIVDEDPLFSMVYTSEPGLSHSALQAQITSGIVGNIELSLNSLMQEVLAGRIIGRPVRNIVTGAVTMSLTGPVFWRHLLTGLAAVPDYMTFKETILARLVLPQEGTSIAETILAAFEQDVNAALAGDMDSHRFGLTWTEGKPETLTFRCDVLRPIRKDSPPMMILDAYADPGIQEYQLMFPNHTVTYHELQPPIPLNVESRLDWSIDLINLSAGRQPQLRNFVLSHIGRLGATSKSGVLVLSYRKIVRILGQAKNLKHLKLHAPDLTEGAVAWAHWYAGRGVNKFSGRHVVALHAPERPAFFEHHQLAALAPSDATRRKKLAGHLRDTELLQMLHRGRQTTFHPDDPARPRVIVAFDVPVLRNRRWVNQVEEVTSQEFQKGSGNPHHRYALHTLARELQAVLGGIPFDCLVALGLYQTSDSTKEAAKRKQRFMAALKVKARSSKRKAPHLHAWKGSDLSTHPLLNLSPFSPKSGKRNVRILQELGHDGELSDLKAHEISLRTDWGGGTTTVYAATQLEAEEAIRKLGGLP